MCFMRTANDSHLFSFSWTSSEMRGSQMYFPARTVLFRKEPNGVTYRVPALIYLPSSTTFLAFCEERLSPADAQANLLVMRKGKFFKNYVEVRAVEQYYRTINRRVQYLSSKSI